MGPRRDCGVVRGPPRVARAHYASNFKLRDPCVAFIFLREEKLDMHYFWPAMICRGYRVGGAWAARGGTFKVLGIFVVICMVYLDREKDLCSSLRFNRWRKDGDSTRASTAGSAPTAYGSTTPVAAATAAKAEPLVGPPLDRARPDVWSVPHSHAGVGTGIRWGLCGYPPNGECHVPRAGPGREPLTFIIFCMRP